VTFNAAITVIHIPWFKINVLIGKILEALIHEDGFDTC
jgi:hypothetical protein